MVGGGSKKKADMQVNFDKNPKLSKPGMGPSKISGWLLWIFTSPFSFVEANGNHNPLIIF